VSGAALSATIADEAAGDFLDESAIPDADGGIEEEFAKSPGAYRSIGEAAAELDLPAHVLRYWETQFEALQPLKRSGGRRYYRAADIEFLKQLRGLLHEQGYTIRGVQRLLGGASAETAPGDAPHTEIAERLVLPIGEDLTPQALQAFVAQAAQAGSFGPMLGAEPDASIEPAAPSIDHTSRLQDALNLLLEAKGRLDAVRRRA
jgi:DNA-binding transcriptional MerR regulator